MSSEALVAPRVAALDVERSFSGRRWIFRAVDSERVRHLAEAANLPPALAQLLVARNVAESEVGDYLEPTLKRFLPEPLTLKDMEAAVRRTREGLLSGEKFAVFGDYDVDGSTSAAMLCEFFQHLGVPARLYIPDRMTEGYGPSARAMRVLKDEGVNLVITVDCGAAAGEALDAARDLGLDVIVLDHHAVTLPVPAAAHVNPNQPADSSGLGHLCAAGVTFLFLVALNRELRQSGYYANATIDEPDLRVALDLVGLATICDVVPLIGVNRAFVRGGLARLNRQERQGLTALAAIAGLKAPFTAHHLGFNFGPRINAGGRIGRCSLGVELLTAQDRASADELATILDLHNRERQGIEKTILEEAVTTAGDQSNAPFILLASEGWHPGVIGIVASRLKDRLGKPAFVIGFEGGQGRGSARSIPGIDVGAIVRSAFSLGLIDGGGGHMMAAGFSLSQAQLDPFYAYLANSFSGAAGAIAAANELDIEALVSPAGATSALVDDMARAGPFGAGNPEPLVAAADVTLAFADIVGGHHVRLGLQGGDSTRLQAIAFRVADQALGKSLLASRGRRIHVAGRLRAEEWQGRRRIQLHVEDAAPASA